MAARRLSARAPTDTRTRLPKYRLLPVDVDDHAVRLSQLEDAVPSGRPEREAELALAACKFAIWTPLIVGRPRALSRTAPEAG